MPDAHAHEEHSHDHGHGHGHGHGHDHDSHKNKPSDIIGWYDFYYSGGDFEVCIRPGGNFFCPSFQAGSKWEILKSKKSGDGHDCDSPLEIEIDWSKFGKYKLTQDTKPKNDDQCDKKPGPISFSGELVRDDGSEKTEHDWRKAVFKRPLSSAEKMLFGPDGSGSEWNFIHADGSFLIKFKADGYNHFVCDDFPAHAHYEFINTDSEGDAVPTIVIHWADYGTYEMKITDIEKKLMEGSVQGKPDIWRKATFERYLEHGGAGDSCSHHHH